MPLSWPDITDALKTLATIGASALVGAFINDRFARRPRLITYYGHTAAFTTRPNPGSPVQIYTHTVIVRNAGRQLAQNVRLGHAYLPEFQINPPTEHRVVDLGDGAKDILIPTLAPKIRSWCPTSTFRLSRTPGSTPT